MISLHFNLAFSQCSIIIYHAFGGQTDLVFNFAILSVSKIWCTRKTFFTVYICSICRRQVLHNTTLG